MKIFSLLRPLPSKSSIGLLFITLVLLQSCATFDNQYGKAIQEPVETLPVDRSQTAHTYYFIGDAGNADQPKAQKALGVFAQRLAQADSQSTVVFLGDNIYPVGMPSASSPNRALAEQKLMDQINLTKNFKGKTVFINGNHDWYSGFQGVRDQADFIVEKTADKKAVLPRKSCGIERLKIDDYTVLLTVDSEWFLQNWNKHPNINEDCDIKTREDFFEELKSQINKNQNKVVVVALHHPVYSNGPHGGYFSLYKHVFPYKNIPAPILGSVINYLRKTSGGSPQDIQNLRYSELAKRIRTIVRPYDNVVLVSGHEHTQQYIEKDGVKQIISGAGSKEEEARAIQEVSFSSGKLGFATLAIQKDGRAIVAFYSADEGVEKVIFKKTIIRPIESENVQYDNVPKRATASVYPMEWTQKSSFYRWLWGEHYRAYYGLKIDVPALNLKDLHGGLTPQISGGGNQSLSLRLLNPQGKEYVMRGVRKSASRFVQTAVIKDQYVEEVIQGTYAERFIYDYYTTAHPFTPFVIGDLAEKAEVFHTNPQLYFIPKQEALGRFNAAYGDELYMIEERPTDGHDDQASFGQAKVIVSTDDVIANLRKDEKYQVDQAAYLRARLFDLIIGDWDRHADQWRWSELKESEKITYIPIPRDRDQAFAKIDGALLSLIKKLPPLRHMQSFTSEFAHPRWINKTAFPLDQLLLKNTSEDDWKTQAEALAVILDDAAIEAAFAKLPVEVQDDQMNEIIHILKDRRDGLAKYAGRYYRELRRYVVLQGTDKKDRFELDRLSDGSVGVRYYRDKKNGQELQFENIYDPNITREIWIYGLGDQDEFKVTGTGKSKIKLRLIGGKNKDSYQVDAVKKTWIYDYKDKENTIVEGNSKVNSIISNRYDLNNYNYKKLPVNVGMVLPNLGYNPEDGIKVGFNYSLIQSKFIQDPFTSKHQMKANYSFETKGVDLSYQGLFANATNNWMWSVTAQATSPNFAQNFYGMGNETQFFDKEKGDDFKRVRVQSYEVQPAYRYEGDLGGQFEMAATYQALKVAQLEDRFIAQQGIVNPRVFEFQQYGGFQLQYDYQRYNSVSKPTLGFGFHLLSGWKVNLRDAQQNFGFLETSVNFDHPLDRNENWVIASKLLYKTRFGNSYDFYHASTLGGNSELRGFRPERFSGKTAVVHSTDLRWNIGAFNGGIIPLNYGIYAGFDCGRVWMPAEYSNSWHKAYGLGIWIHAIESITLQSSYFASSDGGRFVLGLGFGF